MKTADLIETLAKQATIMRPLHAPWVGALLWLAGTVLLNALYFFLVRGPTGLALPAGEEKLFETAALCALVLTAAFGAFTAAIPGRIDAPFYAAMLAALFSWITFRAFGTLWAGHGFDLGWPCARDIAIPGVLATGALFAAASKGAPLFGGRVGLLAGSAALGASALTMQAFCHSPEAAHILTWHVLPVVTLAIAAGFVGRRTLTV